MWKNVIEPDNSTDLLRLWSSHQREILRRFSVLSIKHLSLFKDKWYYFSRKYGYLNHLKIDSTEDLLNTIICAYLMKAKIKSDHIY